MGRTTVVFVTLVANLAWWPATALGQNEEWPRLALVPVVDGIDQPTHIANAGDGTGRLFLVEQPGTVRLLKDGERPAFGFARLLHCVTVSFGAVSFH